MERRTAHARIVMDPRLGGRRNLLFAEVWVDADDRPEVRQRELWCVDYDRYRDERWLATDMLLAYYDGRDSPLLGKFVLEAVRRAMDWADADPDGLFASRDHDLSRS